jgi:type II secretory pathway pseudopilin PulG
MKRLRGHFPGGPESGMTIIEVIIAAVILAAAALATFAILAAATRNAQRAKSNQVALDLAQEEMERLRAVPYANLAVSTAPVHSEKALDPNFRVQGTTFALRRSPVGEYAPLVVNEAGVSPKSQFFSGNPNAGGVSGNVYRYVVWRNDPSCPDTQCPTEQDYKQVIVAVRPDGGATATERGYVEVQSKRINPESLNQTPPPPEDEPEDESGKGSVTAQQFYLSDTPCATTGKAVRQAITADHLLHNTLGTCASGPQTGSKPGAPDALLMTSPPLPEGQLNPPLYDYSNDFYLEPNPDTDKGVQIRHDDTAGCHYSPTGTTNPESQVHRWVTDKLTQAFTMGGRVTLEIYTRTLNDALYTGTLCVYLFRRSETSGSAPVATDAFLLNKENGNSYWVYEPEGNGFWPRNIWTRVRLTMEFQGAPLTLVPGERLGMALSVDPANTPADAIPIMYDHPNYPTRLEVDTKTPIAGE